MVELQETVLLSDGENDGENDGVAVRSFSSDELVIQDAVEDVVAEDDEGVAVETCVMSLEGEDDEEDGVTVAEEELVEERENELHSSGDYLMISCETFIPLSTHHSSLCPFIPLLVHLLTPSLSISSFNPSFFVLSFSKFCFVHLFSLVYLSIRSVHCWFIHQFI